MPRPRSLYSQTRWRKVRAFVLERDEGVCQLRLPGCTVVADEVDHIVPVKAGGALLDPTNCRASCRFCNRSREDQSRKQRRPKPSREW
jgi:5-methylcytosine-specific restriction endonuclease McrA